MALTRRSEDNGNNGGGGADIPNLDVGEHDGRLVYVADLGLQTKEYKGEVKGDFQQISLGIEIVGESITIDDKEVPRYMWTKPMYIYNTLTEKGKELVYFKVFDSSAEAGEVPDWEAQLGKPCTVVVKHVHKDDKTYDNIADILPIPAKYQDGVDEATISFGIGDSEDEDNSVNKALFGLAKFVFDKRVTDAKPDADKDDDGPY